MDKDSLIVRNLADKVGNVPYMTPMPIIPLENKNKLELNLNQVPVPSDKDIIYPTSKYASFFDLIKENIRASLSTDLINYLEGRPMTNDLKATITGVVGGILTILSGFGIVIPAVWSPVIIGILVVVLGYFSNKKDAPSVTE